MSVSSSNDNQELYTEDFIFGKQVRLKQLKKGYRFGSDAVLLASYITANKGPVSYTHLTLPTILLV